MRTNLTVPDLRLRNTYDLIDGIPTVNQGCTDLLTGREAMARIIALFTTLAEFVHGHIDYAVGRCTCCETIGPHGARAARYAYRIGAAGEEWGHVDDHDFAEIRHVHTGGAQRDCDGTWPFEHVLRIPSIVPDALRPAYLGGDPDFHDLWTYVVRHEPSSCSGYELTIKVTDTRLDWHTQTDEGWHGGEAYVCSEPYCAHDDPRR